MKYGIIKNQICVFSGSMSQCLYALGMQLNDDWKAVTVKQAIEADFVLVSA